MKSCNVLVLKSSFSAGIVSLLSLGLFSTKAFAHQSKAVKANKGTVVAQANPVVEKPAQGTSPVSAAPAFKAVGDVTEGKDQIGIYSPIISLVSGDKYTDFSIGTGSKYNIMWDTEMSRDVTIGVSAGFGYNKFTTEVSGAGTSTTMGEVGVRALYWPAGKAFSGLFVGPKLDLSISRISPATGKSFSTIGFGLGADVGYQFPFSQSGFLALGLNGGFKSLKTSGGTSDDTTKNPIMISGIGGVGVRF